MVSTITFNGSNIDLAESTTGWTALKISGTGGGPTAAVADGQLQGSGAVTAQVSKQRVALYFDVGAGNELDFTPSGANEGELIYIWGNFLAAALLLNQSAGGLGVFLESSAPTTTQYHLWYFDGADTYAGGWKQFILDPNETVSASAGTGINLASVRYIGLFADVGGTTARFDNLIVDAMRVGTGITVTGTSTTDDMLGDVLADEATNRYGIIKALNEDETAIELAGKLVLGDTTAATNSTITDIDKKIFLANPTYYQAAVTTSVPTDFFEINVVGGTGTNSCTIGKAVGSDAGRSGYTIVGNSNYTLNIDFDDGNVDTNNWYGCSFENITGVISWGTQTGHKCFSNTFSGCNTFIPVGGIQIRNCNFVNVYDDGTADASNRAALLWNDNIDIQSCNFLANTHSSSDVASGIEHDSVTGHATGSVTTADGLGTTLTDTGASFLTTAAVNDIVFNETDSSYGTVTGVTSNTQLAIAGGLTGGTDNDFDLSDVYSVVTPITYTDLVFNGNEADVWNNTVDGLAISKAGTSNPATSAGTNQTIFQGSVTVQVTVVDSNNDPIQNVQTAVFLTDGTEILNADTNASGIASTSYAGSTPANVIIRCRKTSTGSTRYSNFSTTGTIASGTGLDTTVVLTQDTIVSA